MIKNKWGRVPLVLLGFALFNTACAQNPPLTGQAFIAEERLVGNSTVLLNNASYLVPLQKLEDLKIASVHFNNQYAAVFDSLLNKYDNVQLFDGAAYSGNKTLANLTSDLKFYNTIIVQVNDADLSNPDVIDFISTNQKNKNIIEFFYWRNSSIPICV